jgi:hypothetical protein
MDGLLAHLQLKGLLVQLIASPEGRVHQMTTDLLLLAIQNISMALLVGHCPPIRRIAFQFLRLCHNLLVGVAFGDEKCNTRNNLAVCHWNENIDREHTSVSNP